MPPKKQKVVIDVDAASGASDTVPTPTGAATIGKYNPRDIEDIIPDTEWKAKEITAGVLKWYEGHRRDLPWRLPSATPYGVWVSEIMAQQTQIATMLPYWERWMKSFPTPAALAEASEETVRHHWSGLGYYRRATYLHQGAKYVVNTLGGHLPKSPAELKKIPGIGPYTAAAIASISFGVAAAVVDGNVLRVIARIRGDRECNIKDPNTIQRTWSDAEKMVQKASQRPGVWNQAMMEVGATVCKPSGAPLCASCPFATVCRAKALLDKKDITQIEGTIPLLKEATKKRTEHVACAVLEIDRCVLLVRRPASGLLANLLELPTVVFGTKPPESEKMEKELTKKLKEFTAVLPKGLQVNDLKLRNVGVVKHIFSHIDMSIHCFVVTVESKKPIAPIQPVLKEKFEAQGFVPLDRLSDFPLATMVGKVVKKAEASSPEKRKRGRSPSPTKKQTSKKK